MRRTQHSRARLLACTLGLAANVVAASAGAEGESDWPQWRGPALDGISRETAWSSEGAEADLWEKEVGLGYSTVSIGGGRLYTLGHDVDAEQDVVWCLDPTTGAELWKHRFAAARMNKFHNGGSLTTPSYDRATETVFVQNREGGVLALDAATGEVRWQRRLQDERELEVPTWGFAASPLLLGDALYVNVGPILSLSKEDGKTVWESDDYGHAYATPAPLELGERLGGGPALAVFNGRGLAVIGRADGKERAFHEWKTKYDVNAATPVLTADGVFISSGYGHGAALLRLGDEALELAWENKEMRNKMSGCVLIDGHLYGFDENVFKCLGLDGETRWEVRGTGNSAVLGTTNRLVFMTGEGELVVAATDPAEYRELSRTKLFEDGVFWTTPVLWNGLIYCRSNLGRLVCRDHRVAAEPPGGGGL